jgi:hypothetical protein
MSYRDNIFTDLKNLNNLNDNYPITITYGEYKKLLNNSKNIELHDQIDRLTTLLAQKQARIVEDNKEISRLMCCLKNTKLEPKNTWTSSLYNYTKPLFQNIPDYWTPDYLCTHCYICKVVLTSIHHCRRCGHGFCDDCSKNREPVPEKGYIDKQRVCNLCKYSI